LRVQGDTKGWRIQGDLKGEMDVNGYLEVYIKMDGR